MIKKIKEKLGFNQYLDVRLINKSYSRGVRLVKIPYNKKVLCLVIAILFISIITPFTNFALFPLAFWIFRRFA